MTINVNKFFTFLVVFPFFLPNHLFLITLVLPAFFFFINKSGIRVLFFIIISILLGLIFFFRDYIYNYIDYSNFKLTYLFSSLFVAWSTYKRGCIDTIFLRKFFIFYTIANCIVLILQMIMPSLFIWRYIAENEGQYSLLMDQGRMFGFSGNPTHSGYLTMLISLFLISCREKFIYIALSLISVFLLLNKMTILVVLLFGFLLYCIISKGYSIKILILFLGVLVSLLVVSFVIMPYIERWSEVGYETHTITYRMEIYEYIINEFKNYNYLYWGDPNFYSIRSTDAFDSLPALIIIKYGVIILLCIYIVIFLLTPKNFKSLILYLSLVIPAFTMVAFYNTFYTFSIFFLYFSTILILQE
ncbi:hypothetical protein RFH39_13225 [Acinetobacter baumannii]|uniref:hypothetical protein n=2 Tax=Acinetobacter baumannii TaxID=470 RepID=UPI00233E8E40|nr:hypothetical protein [Acinetobacter baumannii]MDC5291146.1 hypothetical protein [Acinetobacter baumannii]MDC5636375.1 hypothetical protein [Acinetobacter baumannii]MDQ8919371.1 hypothetical protein [Acinetobacter baumannii]MDQ8950352.1 hypothetical protein [Acinetobacter baumannii]MDQ8964337.1 hypothetical protein [Acinetobacter baumannii]